MNSREECEKIRHLKWQININNAQNWIERARREKAILNVELEKHHEDHRNGKYPDGDYRYGNIIIDKKIEWHNLMYYAHDILNERL